MKKCKSFLLLRKKLIKKQDFFYKNKHPHKMNKMEPNEEDELLTLNHYGSALSFSDNYFLTALKLMNKKYPVLDLAVSFGFSTNTLLAEGFSVIANDLAEEHLNYLLKSVRKEDHSHLILKPGNALTLEFEEGSLGGIVALRFMHFLSGKEVRELFNKYYSWLAPQGVLVITCVTPYGPAYKKECDDKFKVDLKNGVEWPGEFFLKDIVVENNDLSCLPEKIHVFTAEILIRETKKAGFQIFKVGYQDLEGEKTDSITDKENGFQRKNVSIIAIKD